jgi:hypothetical protein
MRTKKKKVLNKNYLGDQVREDIQNRDWKEWTQTKEREDTDKRERGPW